MNGHALILLDENNNEILSKTLELQSGTNIYFNSNYREKIYQNREFGTLPNNINSIGAAT